LQLNKCTTYRPNSFFCFLCCMGVNRNLKLEATLFSCCVHQKDSMVQSKAPGQGGRSGAKPFKAKTLSFWTCNGSWKFASFLTFGNAKITYTVSQKTSPTFLTITWKPIIRLNKFWRKYFWHNLPSNDYSAAYFTQRLYLHYLEKCNERNITFIQCNMIA